MCARAEFLLKTGSKFIVSHWNYINNQLHLLAKIRTCAAYPFKADASNEILSTVPYHPAAKVLDVYLTTCVHIAQCASHHIGLLVLSNSHHMMIHGPCKGTYHKLAEIWILLQIRHFSTLDEIQLLMNTCIYVY